MKLFLPVGGMFVGTALCCCCGGGGDWEEQLRELEEQSGSSSASSTTEAPDADEGSGTADAAPAASGGSTEGMCGRFKQDGLTAPSGLKVLSCGNFGGTESVVLMGSGSPKDACANAKSWASGKGWSTEYDVESSGTFAITMKETGHRMSIACTDSSGQTTVSIAITEG